MDFAGLHTFLERLEQQKQLPAFLMGAIVACVVWMWVRRRLKAADLRSQRELRKENGALKERLGALSDQLKLSGDLNAARHAQVEAANVKVSELSAQCEALKTEGYELRERLKQEKSLLREAEQRVKDLDAQLKGVLNADVKIWDRPIQGRVAPFRPLSLRRSPIISVVNLKGGVGKTTITANLGAALCGMGQRVLMVDLDFQGSLTSICLSAKESEAIWQSHRTVRDVLQGDPEGRLKAFEQCVTRIDDIPGGAAYLLAADEDFEGIETQLMMQWYTGVLGDDVRCRLREVLHSPRIHEQFDLILLDCPPRLTTGCINALTSSDYVLVPVLLDKTSTEAIPRLLRWLKKLRPQICPDLSVLGVVGNKANPRAALVKRQERLWNNLKDECKKGWGEPVRHFDEAIIRQHAALSHRFAALDPDHQSQYLDLARVILKELPAHARRFTAALHAVPG